MIYVDSSVALANLLGETRVPSASQPRASLAALEGEREGPAKREGEVGLGNRTGFPHLTPALSALGGGEGDYRSRSVIR